MYCLLFFLTTNVLHRLKIEYWSVSTMPRWHKGLKIELNLNISKCSQCVVSLKLTTVA